MAEPDKAAGNKSGRPEPSLLTRIASLTQIALLLPAATFVGWAIGLGLDHWLGQHWIYAVGLIGGAAAGFVQVFRTVRSLLKE